MTRRQRPTGQLRFQYGHGIAIGSLFSGIGGLEMGLEAAVGSTGVSVGSAFHVERNPYSRAVLRTAWPNVPCFDDVRSVGAGNLTRVNWLVGGSPCQDLSKAAYRWGRLGLAGERSGLWEHFARLAEELAPDLVVWENVGGALCVLREKGKVVGPAPVAVVLHDLHAQGYDAWWTTLLAAAVGAPHLRLRVFLVAWRRGGPVARVSHPGERCVEPLDLSGSVWPSGPGKRPRHGEPRRQILRSDSVPFHMERIEADGNAVVPQCGYAVGVAAYAIHRWMRGETMIATNPAASGRKGVARTPQAQGAALAAEALGLARGRMPSEAFASFDEDDLRWADCRGKRGQASPLCVPWPGIGVMINGELRAPTGAPVAEGIVCPADDECSEADPVDGGELSMWPTCTARDWRSGKSSDATRNRNARPLSEVAAPSGFLNPDWTDALMGYRPGYTSVPGFPMPQRKRGSKLE